MTTLKLKRVADIIAGQSPPSELVDDFDGVGLPFLQGNAEFGEGHPVPTKRCNDAPKKCIAGDILLSVRAPVGALNVADRSYGIGRGLCAIRARSVNQGFLWWWLNASVETLNSTAVGSTYDAVTRDDVAALRLDIPSPVAQRAIADYLNNEIRVIDTLISKRQGLVGLLALRRTAVMLAGVSGAFTSMSFDPSLVPWLEVQPPEWRTAKLSLVASLGSGHTPSRSHPEWWTDCTVPWITTGEVAEMRTDREEYVRETRERISDLGIANSSATIHPAGTVVLCRTASAGYSAIMASDMATSQDFATWTCGPLLRPRFLLLCLRAMRQDLLGRLAMGSTHKTIYMPDIESLRIPLPEVQEQDRIVEEVWGRLRKINRLEDILKAQSELLLERRQALITAAVTGQLDNPEGAA